MIIVHFGLDGFLTPDYPRDPADESTNKLLVKFVAINWKQGMEGYVHMHIYNVYSQEYCSVELEPLSFQSRWFNSHCVLFPFVRAHLY